MNRLLLVALLAFCSLLAGCCENESVTERLSPDGSWKYVSFDRDCGATTGSNLQISVLPARERLPNTSANVFIADDNHGATGFVAQSEWISSRVLQITYASRARVFKKESHLGAIEVQYIEESQ